MAPPQILLGPQGNSGVRFAAVSNHSLAKAGSDAMPNPNHGRDATNVLLGKSIQQFGEKVVRPSKGRMLHPPNRRTIRTRLVTAPGT